MVRVILATIVGMVAIASAASAQDAEERRTWTPPKQTFRPLDQWKDNKPTYAPNASTRDSCPGGQVKCQGSCELRCI